jgi:hypothetical protein
MRALRRARTVLPALTLALALPCALVPAADAPYAHADIALGASFRALESALDFRDIRAALAAQGGAARPDLGRRGYGCSRRDDAYADVMCVSHDEKVEGVPTREIRLHFLNSVLQQFSITVEVRHFDDLMAILRARYGEPRRSEPAGGGFPSWHWANGASSIVAYSGPDLLFVSFELATYAEVVKLRERRGRSPGGIEFPAR